MGLTDSKIAAQAVSGACAEAEKSGKNDINAVLANPEVFDLFKRLWSNLPDTTKRKIDAGVAKRKTRDRPKNGRPKKARRLKDCPDTKCILCPDFMAKVPIWSDDPLSFFSEGENRLELKSSPLDEMNVYMNELKERTEMNTIRQRLLKVMYYHLSGWVGWTQPLHERTGRMTQITSNSDVSAWVNDGKRIDKLCRDIGCVEKPKRANECFHLGNLFYSLLDIADSWIQELPVKDLRHERSEQIARLKKRSDLSLPEDRKKLDILANRLASKIWSAFQNAESGLDSEQHPTGLSLGKDPQPSNYSAPSPRQEGRMSEEAVPDTNLAVCATEVASLDREHSLLSQNLQSTPVQITVGSVVREQLCSVPQSPIQFEACWATDPESLPPAERPASFRPSSLSDFINTTASSVRDARPGLFDLTSLCPTSVSDFFPLSSPSSERDTPYHPSSICPTSISDFTRAPQSTQDIAVGAMSLYPTSFSDFTATTPTIHRGQPGLCSDFTQPASQLSGDHLSLDGLLSASQILNTDVAELSPHIVDSNQGLTPVTPRTDSRQFTTLMDMAPRRLVPL